MKRINHSNNIIGISCLVVKNVCIIMKLKMMMHLHYKTLIVSLTNRWKNNLLKERNKGYLRLKKERSFLTHIHKT